MLAAAHGQDQSQTWSLEACKRASTTTTLAWQQEEEQPWGGRGPRTCSMGVLLKFLLQSLQGKRTELLHTDECCVLVGRQRLPLLHKGIVVLPGAQHHLLDAAWKNKNI